MNYMLKFKEPKRVKADFQSSPTLASIPTEIRANSACQTDLIKNSESEIEAKGERRIP